MFRFRRALVSEAIGLRYQGEAWGALPVVPVRRINAGCKSAARVSIRREFGRARFCRLPA